MANPQSATYINGHQESVLRSHKWRTVENSAAYLLPHLKPDMHILDVGCGPGTITAGLAKLVPAGRVVGLENVPDVLDKARAHAATEGVSIAEFTVGDIHALPFPNGTFDVVHAHQVLQHVADPARVLREMRRVAKPAGGIVAVREADFGGMTWFPGSEGMDAWRVLYSKVARANGGEPDAGRRMLAWALQAGFERAQTTCSAGTWCYYTPEERAWWGGLWADRTLSSNFASTALKHGIYTQEGLEKAAEAWRQWRADEDGWCTLIHGELIAKV